MSDYTAASIRIATDAEIVDAWDWARVGHWCQVYGCHAEWLARAVEACRRAGREPEYLQRRYLDGRRDEEPHDPSVDAAMREIQEEERRRSFQAEMREARRGNE